MNTALVNALFAALSAVLKIVVERAPELFQDVMNIVKSVATKEDLTPEEKALAEAELQQSFSEFDRAFEEREAKKAAWEMPAGDTQTS
jgi:hypothetical protein